MFRAPPASVKDLSWHAKGPGPDSRVLLRSSLVINRHPFTLYAFRIPAPFSAGWSMDASWEDDRGTHIGPLLWDIQAFRSHVHKIDNNPLAETIAESLPAMTESMQTLAISWLSLCSLLSWVGSRWKPSLINGQPYIVLGYPDLDAKLPSSSITVSSRESRNWSGMEKREKCFNLDIEGATCCLHTIEVRSLGITGGRHPRIHPLSQAGKDWLSKINAILHEIPYQPKIDTLVMTGHAVLAMILPEDETNWSFDRTRFIRIMRRNLERGKARWCFNSGEGICTELTSILTGLADLTRHRELEAFHSEPCATLIHKSCPKWMKTLLPGHPLRGSLLFDLGRTMIRGIHLDRKGKVFERYARAVTRLYALDDRTHICLSRDFVEMATTVSKEDLLLMTDPHTAVETNPPIPAEWVSYLPILQIRRDYEQKDA
jgi:hypothetical protein